MYIETSPVSYAVYELPGDLCPKADDEILPHKSEIDHERDAGGGVVLYDPLVLDRIEFASLYFLEAHYLDAPDAGFDFWVINRLLPSARWHVERETPDVASDNARPVRRGLLCQLQYLHARR